MASGISKLQLLIDLKNKLKVGLDSAKNQVKKATGDMQGKLDAFKTKNIELFNAIKDEVPGVGRALSLLTNPYVLVAAAAMTAAVAIGSATKKAMEFEHTYMNIRQLNLDKSRSELDKYRSEIRDTALDVGINLNKMTSGYYDLQSGLGVYGKEATKIAQQVGKYSISTQADYNDSINQTVKAMKAFKIEAPGVKQLLESNAKTVQVGIVTFSELARVQTEYAGAASSAGQSIDTANKIFAAFTSIAKNADVAATMTKTAFQGLADPMVLKGIEKYGIKVYDNTGKMRDLDKVLKETSSKIDAMNDKKFNKFMGDVGGPEGLRALFGKLRTGADDFFKTLEAYDKSPVNLDQMYKNALQDPATAASIVKEQFNTLFISFGLLFLPIVTKISNWIINTIKYFRDLYKESTLFRDVLTGIGVAFTISFKMVIIPLKQVWNLFKGILDVISSIFNKIFGLTGGISEMYNKIRPYLMWMYELFKQIGNIIYHTITGSFKDLIIDFATFKMPDLNEIRQRFKIESESTGDFSGVPEGDANKINNVNTVVTDAESIKSGAQTKNVTITIDSFIKGFTPTHQSINGMNKDELERWLTEMFLRVVRSAETTI